MQEKKEEEKSHPLKFANISTQVNRHIRRRNAVAAKPMSVTRSSSALYHFQNYFFRLDSTSLMLHRASALRQQNAA